MSRELCDALAAWRLHRTGFHAAVVERLSDTLTRERPAFPDSHWYQICAAGDPLEVGPLLASLPPASSSELLKRLDALRRFPADPRIAEALRWLVQSADDLGAPRHRPLWRRVFAMVAELGDPRVRTWLPEAIAHQSGGTPAFLHWLGAQVWAIANALPPTPVEPPASFAPPEEVPWMASMSSAERLVTSDWLSGHGDPLGEFLVLQLATPGLKTQARRTRELVRLYGRRWLGPLSMAVRPDGLRFEGGLAVAGTLSGRRALELTGHPGWASFKELDLRALRCGVIGRQLERFLSHRVLNVHTLRAVPCEQLEAIFRARAPVTTLELLGWVAGGMVQECWRTLPRLARLKANGMWLTR